MLAEVVLREVGCLSDGSNNEEGQAADNGRSFHGNSRWNGMNKNDALNSSATSKALARLSSKSVVVTTQEADENSSASIALNRFSLRPA